MNSTLAIECSTPKATIAMVDGNGVVIQREFNSDRRHNALLFEPLEDLLRDSPKVDRVLVGSGPGSYSGTRVGIAAAQGIGLALGCPVIAIPSILGVPAADDGKACLAIGDARRGSYWTAQIFGHALEQEPELCAQDELKHLVSNAIDNGLTVFTFDPADRFPSDAVHSKVALQHPDATRLWHAWLGSSPTQQEAWQSKVAQPIYLKPPHITPGKRPKLIQD